MSHFGGASAVAGAAGSFIIVVAASGCDAPLTGGAADLPFMGGLPAAAGGAGRAACTGGLATIGGLTSIGGSVTPVTAASGRAGGRSATQFIPNTTFPSATASTAETAMNVFVRSENEGSMA